MSPEKIKILFVCMGNICRSPLAHAVFLDKVTKAGVKKKFEIESCGTGAWHVGQLPDKRMRAEAQRHNITMNHRGRVWQKNDDEYFDLILTMDNTNLQTILSRSNSKHHDKIKLFRTYDPSADTTEAEVPDPYYGGEDGFKLVYEIVNRTCENLLQELLK